MKNVESQKLLSLLAMQQQKININNNISIFVFLLGWGGEVGHT